MKFALLDTVVLTHNLPEHGLRAGDLGAVVELYGEDGKGGLTGDVEAIYELQCKMCFHARGPQTRKCGQGCEKWRSWGSED